MIEKKPMARMDLEATRTEFMHMRCSSDLKQALLRESEQYGITLSDLLNSIAVKHVCRNRLSGIPGKTADPDITLAQRVVRNIEVAKSDNGRIDPGHEQLDILEPLTELGHRVARRSA